MKLTIKLITLFLITLIGFNSVGELISVNDQAVLIENIDFEEPDKTEKEDKSEEDKEINSHDGFDSEKIKPAGYNLHFNHYTGSVFAGIYTPPPEINS